MSRKIVFFAFEGEKMCFSHLLINAIDLKNKGHEVKIVIEGKATRLVEQLFKEDNTAFRKAIDLNLIDSICKACANQMGVLDYIKETPLTINGDLHGHPPMEPFINDGYEVIIM